MPGEAFGAAGEDPGAVADPVGVLVGLGLVRGVEVGLGVRVGPVVGVVVGVGDGLGDRWGAWPDGGVDEGWSYDGTGANLDEMQSAYPPFGQDKQEKKHAEGILDCARRCS